MTFKYQIGQRVKMAATLDDWRRLHDKFGRADNNGVGFVLRRRESRLGNWYKLDCYPAWVSEHIVGAVEPVPEALSTWDEFRRVMHEAGEELDPSKEPVYINRR